MFFSVFFHICFFVVLQTNKSFYLQESVPDIETRHIVTVVEDGDLLEAGDQGEPLVLFRLFIPAEQGGVGVEALLVPVHNGVQQSGPGIIVCSCFPSTQNVRKFRLVSCNTTVCPRSSDLFYVHSYSNLLFEMGHYFLDRLYVDHEQKNGGNAIFLLTSEFTFKNLSTLN